MPKSDISVQDGSLLAREGAIRMFWDLLVQDWVGIVPKRHPILRREAFTTAWPRNFTNEQYENGSWYEKPVPVSVPYVRYPCEGSREDCRLMRLVPRIARIL